MSFITINEIGSSGNLGSQIQQYASLLAISKQTNKKIVFSKSSMTLGFGLKFSKILNENIQIVEDNFISNFKNVYCKDVLYDECVFDLEENVNYNFCSLFHSYHYWYPKYQKEVLDLSWNEELLKQANAIKQSILPKDKQIVSIHVRRGDYLLPQHHHFCQLDNEYYESAISYFLKDIENYHFAIFSNDILWCKQNLIEGEMVTFVEHNSDYIDLILMSLCDHNIIANSSFSWWAAYMNKNKNKKVICPENYIKNYSDFNFLNSNYQLPNWKRITNPA